MTVLDSPTVTPPVVTPPVVTPPVVTPPVVTPPVVTPPPTAITTPTVVDPAEWRKDIPDDIKNDPSMAAITDINSLAKSYVHAQRAMGKEKIQIPDKFATPEELSTFYTKLGRPELEKYDITVEDGIKMDGDVFKNFKTIAHNAGVMPAQAQKIFDWFNKTSVDMATKQDADSKNDMESNLGKLKAEWGNGYEKNIFAAKAAISEFDDDAKGFAEYLEKSGAGNNPSVIKFLNKIGKGLAEDVFRGTPKGSLGKTPDELNSELNAIMGNGKHAYWTKDHPEHKAAVVQVQKIQAELAKAS